MRLRVIFVHPLIIVPLVVIGLGFGWHAYKASARRVSVPQHNLLPHASFDHFTRKGAPDGWSLEKNGRFSLTTSSAPGYVSERLFAFEVENYQQGDALLLTPKVALQPNTTYLYKSYYLAGANFDLLVKYFYRDGTSSLRFVRSYPHFDDPWSTVSTAFASGETITAVQIGYRVAGNGDVQIDAPYIEQTDNVWLPDQPKNGSNLIKNADFAVVNNNVPDDWSPYSEGDNHMVASCGRDEAGTFLHLEAANFKQGETKWEHTPLAATAGRRYAVAVDYRAGSAPELVAEYSLPDGKRQFEVLDVLAAAWEWTHYETTFEPPKATVEVMISLVLHHNGSVDSRNYQLQDITKPGPLRFSRPLVSFTFDDGWESAYATGAPMLESYGFRGTFYINPGAIGNDDSFMKPDQVRELLRRNHDIASHGYDHVDMTALSQQELAHQLGSAAGYLTRRLNLRDIDFAAPYGKDDPQVQAALRRFYRSHRGTETGINTRQNFDPYNLRVMFVRTDTPLSVIQAQIDDAKASNGWFILTYHRIENSDSRSEMITFPTVFKQHLELIKQSGLQVSTVHGALDELNAQQNR